MLIKNKVNSNESLMSQALIDSAITYEEFKTIANERERYERMKKSIRNIKSNNEKDELNENSWNNRENNKMYLFFFCIYKNVLDH